MVSDATRVAPEAEVQTVRVGIFQVCFGDAIQHRMCVIVRARIQRQHLSLECAPTRLLQLQSVQRINTLACSGGAG